MSKSLLKSTAIVSLMTFCSRILGFTRDLIAAQIFGVSAATDAFYIAFKIPNFTRNLFAEGAFSQAFVPVLSGYIKNNEKEAVRVFIRRVAGCLGMVLFLVTLLFIFCSKEIVDLFAPGLDPMRFEMANHMLRITAPYLMLISLTAFFGGILNSYGNFAIPSITPALLNICLIASAFGMAHYFNIPIESQAWGVLVAGVIQFFFQWPSLYRLNLLCWPQVHWKDPGVRRVLKLMLPAIFGASVGQISVLLNTILASFLAVGSVSWLYYSERLAYFPLGVFGVALSTVALPRMSQHHATNANEAFSKTLHWGIRCNLLIGLPASLTMIILSGPLIVSLILYGKLFTVHDVMMTQRSVIAYAIGLQAFMLIKLLASAFYSRQEVKTPVKVAVWVLIFNMFLSIGLIFPFAHAGLALATSLSSWANVTILAIKLYRLGVLQADKSWTKFLMQLLFSNSVVGAFLWFFSPNITDWIQWQWPSRLGHIVLLGVMAIIIYVATLWLSGMRWKDFKQN